MIDAKLWKMFLMQRRHNVIVEDLLREIRDRSVPK